MLGFKKLLHRIILHQLQKNSLLLNVKLTVPIIYRLGTIEKLKQYLEIICTQI